jgi:hypothetical protein
VTAVPLSDANIFPEYILPNLMPLCHDRNDLVRAAFASNISVVNFLNIIVLHPNKGEGDLVSEWLKVSDQVKGSRYLNVQIK